MKHLKQWENAMKSQLQFTLRLACLNQSDFLISNFNTDSRLIGIFGAKTIPIWCQTINISKCFKTVWHNTELIAEMCLVLSDPAPKQPQKKKKTFRKVQLHQTLFSFRNHCFQLFLCSSLRFIRGRACCPSRFLNNATGLVYKSILKSTLNVSNFQQDFTITQHLH